VSTSDEFCSQTRLKIGSLHCAAAFCLQVPKSCTALDLTLLYIWTLGTYNICTEKQNASARRLPPAAMPERWPQVCRVKITFELLKTICLVSTATKSMNCLVNWIPLNTHVRIEDTQPCLKASTTRDFAASGVVRAYSICLAQQSVRFPQCNLGPRSFNLGISPKYSGTQIIARDSHSNRLTSEDIEFNLSSSNFDRKKPTPPRAPPPPGGVLVGWFPNQEPGGRGPHLKNHPQNWSICGVVLQGGSNASRFLIREHSK